MSTLTKEETVRYTAIGTCLGIIINWFLGGWIVQICVNLLLPIWELQLLTYWQGFAIYFLLNIVVNLVKWKV